MSQRPNVSAQLREGINAARRGDKVVARRLLQQVLSLDGNNELALMWMASVVEDLSERRFYLERALQINPDNARAREALIRLGGNVPARGRSGEAPPPPVDRGGAARRSSGRGLNIYLVAAAVVAFLVIALVVTSLFSALQPAPAATPTPVAQATLAAMFSATEALTPGQELPTSTPQPVAVVTIDPKLVTPLPPTFTPTFTYTPSDTPTPTITPLPLGNFTMVYSDFEPNIKQPSLYQGNADGTGEVKLESGQTNGGFTDVAYDKVGQQIAFIRPVNDQSGNPIPQLFVAPLSRVNEIKKLTTMTGTEMSHPSWSPDGTRLVFSDNQDGTEELWVINADGSNLTQLTTDSARDFDPAWSPDGKQIAYTSDLNSPGFTEVYLMSADGSNITVLTDTPNSYSPAWSPDGSRIAYVSNQEGDGDIYVMDADGQRPFLLTQDDNGAEDRTPVWTPDGHWIVFASNRENNQFNWYAMDLQGTIKPITANDRNPQSLSFVIR